MSDNSANIHASNLIQGLRSGVMSSTQILTEIISRVDAQRMFVAVAAKLLIAPANEISEVAQGSASAHLELLAYYSYPYFQQSQNYPLSPKDTERCITELHRLMSLRLLSGTSDSKEGNEEKVDTARTIIGHVKMHAELVRGSAYPEQTREEIHSIQGHYESWLEKRAGIGPKRTLDILNAIHDAQHLRVSRFMPEVHGYEDEIEGRWRSVRNSRADNDHLSNTLRGIKHRKEVRQYAVLHKLNEFALTEFTVGFADLAAVSPEITEAEWNALILILGFTVEIRESMLKPVEGQQWPVYVFSNQRILITDLSNTADVIWNKFDQILKTEEKTYQKYQRKRSEWLEHKLVESVRQVFPARSVYRNVDYPDPDKGITGGTAELDTAIKWGPFLVLIEAKAKQFRTESQLGDVGRLVTDLKVNLQDAFTQAQRAVRYLESTQIAVFTERGTGRKLELETASLERIYIITISQHHLAGLATRLATLRELGLFKDDKYPIALSIGDFEIICRFCESPDVFLHHLERRDDIQKNSQELYADDLDLFGAYLDTRLQPSRLWAQSDQQYTAAFLSGWSDMFDRWMMFRRGDLPHEPIIELKIPREIKAILDELRTRDEDNARWISFCLLDMPDQLLGSISKGFQDLWTANLEPGRFRRIVDQHEDTVICIVASKDQSSEALMQRTHLRTLVEKYRRKARRSIGFGINVRKGRPLFEYASWAEDEWQYSQEIEDLLKDDAPFYPTSGQKLPGVNAPCVCGSNRKFKKCCLPKIQEHRTSFLQG